MTYSFAVPNGTYQVRLHFAENYSRELRRRAASVRCAGGRRGGDRQPGHLCAGRGEHGADPHGDRHGRRRADQHRLHPRHRRPRDQRDRSARRYGGHNGAECAGDADGDRGQLEPDQPELGRGDGQRRGHRLPGRALPGHGVHDLCAGDDGADDELQQHRARGVDHCTATAFARPMQRAILGPMRRSPPRRPRHRRRPTRPCPVRRGR